MDADGLSAVQVELAAASPPPWHAPAGALRLGGCWVTFPRGLTGPGEAGDPAWAAAVTLDTGRVVASYVETGRAGAAYAPGLLAGRVGALLARAVRGLSPGPEVLLIDAAGRDHPRRAGLAVHLGAVLDLPTVGVTHRPLLAEGDWPEDTAGAVSPLRIGDEVVAAWVRTRPGTRPLVVHPGWRVDLDTAVGLVLGAVASHRTPEPLRQARHLARTARLG